MPVTAALTTNLVVQVAGEPLAEEADRQLLRGTVEQSRHLPDSFTLVFRDPARSVLRITGIKIGAEVTISVKTLGSDPEVLLQGAEVTALEAEVTPEGTLTVVRGMDRAFRAYNGRTVAAYKNCTLSDAVKQVAQRAGLQVGKVDATTKVYDNLTQNAVSDWAFIVTMAREVGFDAWVSDGKVNFCRPADPGEGPGAGRLASTNPLQLTPKDDLRSFRCVLSAGQQVSKVTVRGWDFTQKQAVVGTAEAQNGAAANGMAPADLAKAVGGAGYLEAAIPRSSQEEADRMAQVIADTIGGSSTVFEGVSVGNPKLRAGTPVSIGLLGDPFDGNYTLSEVRHTVEAEGYTTWFTASGRNDRSLLGLSRGAAGRDDLLGGRRIPGVVTAIVSNNKDPLGQCRVKVTLPWLSEAYESDWARNVQVWAGSSYGSVVVPEVGDEVLVAFEQGDVHRPFVLGGLYNGKDLPHGGSPELVDDQGRVNRRDLVSRTGHVVSMTELQGTSDGISIRTAGDGYRLELDKLNKTVTLDANGSVVIEARGTGQMTVKAAGDLQISGRRISIKAQSGVSIDGGAGPVEVKGGPKVSVEAAKVEVTGAGAADLKSGGMVTVQGALVKIN